ncbi:MAG TPA: ketoacyl-ACP synthase III [Edaphobacter sp.]|jgi:3-oxoacyl-[acyl-carrier-protein] synthase-3|nr:ketoacyl-ACP synthase III [Edaphobacter sp.]
MSYLRAFGHYLPERIVTNADLETRTGRAASSIEKTSGILERRYAEESTSVADLGLAATNACLKNANLIPQDIGLILFSSGSAERAFPGPASVLAQKLGLTATPAIDIPVASAGSLIALAFAADFAPRYGNILVVASEIMSRRISDADPDTAILFGDGAGVAIVSPDQGLLRIADTALFTDGNYADALQLQHGGFIQMKGLDVIVQASRKIPRSIEDLLTKNNLRPTDVGVFLMHQANVNLIRKVATALSVPEARFFRNISRYGNTSSASLLIAASEWRTANPTPPTTPVVLAAFGAGFNWGAILALPA